MSIWGSVLGAGIGALGSVLGGNQQARAAQQAADMQMRMFQQNRQDAMPWLDAGRNALASYAPQVNRPFEETEAYRFNLGEGQRAINAQMAARGMTGSTARGRALSRYTQGMASQEFQNYLNRLSGLAGVGQTAAQNIGAMGMGAAGQAGQATMQAGGAQGAGTVGAFNALNRGLENYALMAALGRQ